MMWNYLETCPTKAIRSGERQEIYEGLMDVIFKFGK